MFLHTTNYIRQRETKVIHALSVNISWGWLCFEMTLIETQRVSDIYTSTSATNAPTDTHAMYTYHEANSTREREFDALFSCWLPSLLDLLAFGQTPSIFPFKAKLQCGQNSGWIDFRYALSCRHLHATQYINNLTLHPLSVPVGCDFQLFTAYRL